MDHPTPTPPFSLARTATAERRDVALAARALAVRQGTMVRAALVLLWRCKAKSGSVKRLHMLIPARRDPSCGSNDRYNDDVACK